MTDLTAVQNLIASWWFDYDQGNFEAWPRYLTPDAHFSCQSDSGATDYEEFIRADLTGRDQMLAWQIDHRKNSPYPLRHNATNVHITSTLDGEARYRSYLFVTSIVAGVVTNTASGLCLGTVREDDGHERSPRCGSSSTAPTPNPSALRRGTNRREVAIATPAHRSRGAHEDPHQIELLEQHPYHNIVIEDR